jgi:hypothetical protein
LDSVYSLIPVTPVSDAVEYCTKLLTNPDPLSADQKHALLRLYSVIPVNALHALSE